MKTLRSLLKATLCLSLILFCIPNLSFAIEDTPVEDVSMVSSTNPIMVIRCGRQIAQFSEQESKGTTSKRIIDLTPSPDCSHCNDELSGCSYFYNTETQMCEEKDFDSANKATSKDAACPDCDPLCPDDVDGNAYTFVDGECVIACYDGEVTVEIPQFDCSNLPNSFGHIPIEICFTAADPNNPLIPGQRIPLADIQNCFGDAGEELLAVALADNGGVIQSGEEYYFAETVGTDGKLCVDFFVDPDEPLIINFTNSTEVVIPTCFEDPCSCENPNIVVGGEVVSFYDVLSNLGPLPAGGSVTLLGNDNPAGFTDASGTPIPSSTVLVDPIPASGAINYVFYRGSGEAADIMLEIADGSGSTTSQRYISPTVCNATDCPVIPTMGQWSLLILGMILTSLGLVYIRKRAILKA